MGKLTSWFHDLLILSSLIKWHSIVTWDSEIAIDSILNQSQVIPMFALTYYCQQRMDKLSTVTINALQMQLFVYACLSVEETNINMHLAWERHWKRNSMDEQGEEEEKKDASSRRKGHETCIHFLYCINCCYSCWCLFCVSEQGKDEQSKQQWRASLLPLGCKFLVYTHTTTTTQCNWVQ